jgi:hypothetical protein
MHQLGGARHSWTVPVIMLRSVDWNAHEAYVPPPPEDPAPDNGNPHPLYGHDLTAEQLYQQQLALWWQQNGAAGQHNQHGHHPHGHHHQQGQQHNLHHGHQHGQHQVLHHHQAQQVNANPQLDQAPPLFNFQHMLAEQGALFTDGLLPPNNMVDSPMQAWNDSLSADSSSSSSVGDNMLIDVQPPVQINSVILHEGNFAALQSELWARVTLARATLSTCGSPSVNQDNCRFLSVTVEMPASILHEMVGEFYTLYQSRLVARKTETTVTPPVLSLERNGLTLSEDANIGQKRKQALLHAPECSSQVRRSTRSNKYDGFKQNNNPDVKPLKSKVKPRKIPRVKEKILIKGKDSAATSAVLPDTPIQVMQSIAVNLCGVPAEEISPQKLLSTLQEEDPEDNV